MTDASDSRPTRRRLLKWGSVGALMIGTGVWFYRTTARFGPPAPGRAAFDANEFAILEAVAMTMFPGPPVCPLSADEVGVAARVDDYVAGLYADTQLLFRALVRTLNLTPVVTYGRSFFFLPPELRTKVLESWRQSEQQLRRAGHQSLSFALRMAYFEDARVRAAAGFTHGCALGDR
jgi:Gluconate 2-dehydrogenase subunit 3